MDYRKTYDRLIQKRRDNPITKADCYCETHHIVPRSEGGSDDDTNLVNLTAREHYIAHLLLARIYDDFKMWAAVLYMRIGHKEREQSKFNSRLYEVARIRFGAEVSKMKKGKPNMRLRGRLLPDWHRMKLSESHKGRRNYWWGRHLSDEHKMRLSESHKRENISQETRRKMSTARLGTHPSDETRRKMSEVKSGENHPNFGKHLSEDTRKKISESKKGKKRTEKLWWFNNGIRNTRGTECPEGFVLGRLNLKKGK